VLNRQRARAQLLHQLARRRLRLLLLVRGRLRVRLPDAGG
jgi:hypothetical protein